MIIISNWKNADYDLMDEVWFITNNNPKMPSRAKHHPELAPEVNSYNAYRRGVISLQQLLDSYEEDLKSGVFDKEITNLISYQENKLIQLVCYCTGSCHRFVLAKFIKERYDVEVRIM